MKTISRKRAGALVTAFVVVIVILDRLTKQWAVANLSSGQRPFIPRVLDFLLVYNRGAAWSMLEGARWYFVILALVIVVCIALYIVFGKTHTPLEAVALGLFAAGAIGNAIDRMLTGAVVDFIHTLFIDFPVFNIADCAITIGAILFIITLVFAPGGILRVSPEQVGEADRKDSEPSLRRPLDVEEHDGDAVLSVGNIPIFIAEGDMPRGEERDEAGGQGGGR